MLLADLSIIGILLETLSENEVEQFVSWAWEGPRFHHTTSNVLMHAWNEKHGKLLNIQGNDMIRPTLDKMIVLWREHGAS